MKNADRRTVISENEFVDARNFDNSMFLRVIARRNVDAFGSNTEVVNGEVDVDRTRHWARERSGTRTTTSTFI